MALRVERGLFRLWLILSVRIGGVGIAEWRTFIYPKIVVCEEVEATAPESWCLPRSLADPQNKDRLAAFQFALVHSYRQSSCWRSDRPWCGHSGAFGERSILALCEIGAVAVNARRNPLTRPQP